MKTSYCIAIGTLSILLAGCDSEQSAENWDLATAPNGVVYRINKKTGDVSLIDGTQITKLGVLKDQKTDEEKKSHLIEYPPYPVDSLGGITFKLKTKWRDGKIHYILSVTPYTPQIQRERENPLSSSQFHINFYDTDGFKLLSLPVKIFDMTQAVDQAGQTHSMGDNGCLGSA